ncbi:MAG TPA: tRNA glutamyl-Q(34) synthetase GluQRS [Burkholderiales bacterium]|nr:tRNA glutamyl-Q(34) synthetase GluQRS [Burkholderiales bacterium]
MPPAAASRYRGRFAPSPTGPLHFGSLVAAAGSFLEARARGGEWLVRMEDLDPPRVVPGAADDILRTLEALGFAWDGAVEWQSRRGDAYHAALERLRETGLVYPCACSRKEVADSAVTGIEGFVYPGTCRGGLPPGREPRALRLNTAGQAVEFEDALQGTVRQQLDTEIGDFVVYRADRVYAYQLAVVVDDAWQEITHVVRGADLLASTPRQIWLQRLLGYPTPEYLHLPVAVNAAGEKLGKQTGAAAVPAADPLPSLLAALDFLGHRPPPQLARGRVRDLWAWATENWDSRRLPRKRTIPLPG